MDNKKHSSQNNATTSENYDLSHNGDVSTPNDSIAITYELIMRRAYSYQRYEKREINSEIFRSLYTYRKKAHHSLDPALKKIEVDSIKEIKGFIICALENAQKRKMENGQVYRSLTLCIWSVKKAISIEDLYEPLEDALDIFIESKIE